TGAVIDGPDDPGCDHRVVAGSPGVENLDRHDRAAPADAGHALVVVRAGADDACDRCAVALVVGGIGVRVDEVVAGGEGGPEIRLARVDAGVEDGDHDPVRAVGH